MSPPLDPRAPRRPDEGRDSVPDEPMSLRFPTGGHPALSPLDARTEKRLETLETEGLHSRDHRTKVNTLLGVVGTLGVALAGLTVHAIATRDLARDNAARVEAQSSQIADLRTDARLEFTRRAIEDRATRDALAGIQSDVRAVIQRLDLETPRSARAPH